MVNNVVGYAQFCGCWRRLSVEKWLETGRPGAESGAGGDPCVGNEKSPKLGSCSLAEGSLFGHWRFGAAFVQLSCRSTRRGSWSA